MGSKGVAILVKNEPRIVNIKKRWLVGANQRFFSYNKVQEMHFCAPRPCIKVLLYWRITIAN